ncbi:YciI family protein [Georgenia sp. H159]|uniref:YciI family protein n=1 Tax=Georgenia sp. H159 TaxID=3076115 RepID=UPI002D791E54|nr:YciI family protein [Georgenia sp. H159]
MKYLVLLIGDGDMPAWSTLSPEEQGAAMQRFVAFDDACQAREGVDILAGGALGDSAGSTVMTTRSGKVTLTEGPYAEAVEGLGGFYLMEVPDLDVLVELLAELPPYDIQLSPVVDPY